MAKCPACSAENSPGVTVCEFCGTNIPSSNHVEPAGSPVSAADPMQNQAQPAAAASQQGNGVRTFKCDSCGAVVTYSATEKAMHCAYCGSAYVVESPESRKKEHPSRIVPFGVDRDKALGLFQTWLGKGFWRPGDLKARASIGAIQGVYLPFWAFDVQADSRWSASAGYYYYVNEEYTDNEGKRQTRKVQKTRWQPADGQHYDSYRDWLVSASGGLDQEWVGKIVPFDLAKATPYASDYLAGWAAEEYSIEPDSAQPVAENEIEAKERSACESLVPGDTHKDLRVSTRFSNWARELLVLPIWISSYQYGGKVYRFLVNGQTGEVVGNAPVSKLKVAIAIAIGAAVVIGGVAFAVLSNQ